MLRSMNLGGLDEAVAAQVGLFSVLDMQCSWDAQPGAQGAHEESGFDGMGDDATMALSPAPPTPP